MIYVLLFIIYEVGYKLFVVNKIKTDISESIKHLYNEKLENLKLRNVNENNKLKSALDKLLSLQLQHRNEERQALMNFLSNCNQWIFGLSKIDFKNYSVQNIKDLDSKIDNIQDDHFLNIYAERIKILLFISDIEVNTSTNQLVDAIEEYEKSIKRKLSELMMLLMEQYNSRYEYEDIFDDIGAAIVTAYSIDNTHKIKELSLDFNECNLKLFKKCKTEIETFVQSSKYYLLSLES